MALAIDSACHLVPWRSFDEWCVVRDLVISKRWAHAVCYFSMWQARAKKLPVAIEATLYYAQIQIEASREALSELSLQLLYSAYFIRLVNGILDPEQKLQRAQPISMLARKIHFPKWFVDLRHEATHEELPSLESLKEAGRCSFQWLLDVYWNEHFSILMESTEKTIVAVQNFLAAAEIREKQAKALEEDLEMFRKNDFIRGKVLHAIFSSLPGWRSENWLQFLQISCRCAVGGASQMLEEMLLAISRVPITALGAEFSLGFPECIKAVVSNEDTETAISAAISHCMQRRELNNIEFREFVAKIAGALHVKNELYELLAKTTPPQPSKSIEGREQDLAKLRASLESSAKQAQTPEAVPSPPRPFGFLSPLHTSFSLD